jgi:hypothetical protein
MILDFSSQLCFRSVPRHCNVTAHLRQRNRTIVPIQLMRCALRYLEVQQEFVTTNGLAKFEKWEDWRAPRHTFH